MLDRIVNNPSDNQRAKKAAPYDYNAQPQRTLADPAALTVSYRADSEVAPTCTQRE